MWYGWFLTQVSRPQEGLDQARAAEDLDPVNPFLRILVTQPLLNLHRYEEALAQVDSVLRLDPEHGAAFIYQANIHLLMGETALARTAVDQAGILLGEGQLPVAALRADIAAREGDEARARDLMAKWEEEHPAMSTAWQAYTFLYLNRENEALEVLERAYVDRYPWLPNMTSAPQVDPIRSDPRFRALRQAMGLPTG
jgi:protein involved in temperature-dependent protein secretion